MARQLDLARVVAGANEVTARGRRARDPVHVGSHLLECLDDVEPLASVAAGEVGVEGRGLTDVGDVAQEDVDDLIHRRQVHAVEPGRLPSIV